MTEQLRTMEVVAPGGALVRVVRYSDHEADKHQAIASALEELAGDMEADARRFEEKRDRDGTAGNVDSEAYNQGKGHICRITATRLREKAAEYRKESA